MTFPRIMFRRSDHSAFVLGTAPESLDIPQHRAPSTPVQNTDAVPSWLPMVEQRIRDSVRPDNRDPSENGGQWIEQDIADAANTVLRETGKLLPSEPHIYSSKKGDLVLESSGTGGRMTVVISTGFVLFFIVIGEQEPRTKRIDLTGDWPAQLDDLKETFKALRAAERLPRDAVRLGKRWQEIAGPSAASMKPDRLGLHVRHATLWQPLTPKKRPRRLWWLWALLLLPPLCAISLIAALKLLRWGI